MSDIKTIEFVDGLIVKQPHSSAPDFVKMKISIKRADLGNWLRGKDSEWINIDVKESKAGKLYCSVDNFVPKQQGEAPLNDPIPAAMGGDIDPDVPFANPYQFTYLCV